MYTCVYIYIYIYITYNTYVELASTTAPSFLSAASQS